MHLSIIIYTMCLPKFIFLRSFNFFWKYYYTFLSFYVIKLQQAFLIHNPNQDIFSYTYLKPNIHPIFENESLTTYFIFWWAVDQHFRGKNVLLYSKYEKKKYLLLFKKVKLKKNKDEKMKKIFFFFSKMWFYNHIGTQ